MDIKIKVKNGPEIVCRMCTEQEFIAVYQKRLDVGNINRPTRDLTDNGTEELLKTILSPSLEQVRKYMRRKPKLGDVIFSYMFEKAGMDDELKTVEEFELDEEMVEKHGDLIIGLKYKDVLIGCKLFSDLVLSAIDHENQKKNRSVDLETLCRYSKAHVLPEFQQAAAELATMYPGFYIALGAELRRQATVEVEEELGKP